MAPLGTALQGPPRLRGGPNVVHPTPGPGSPLLRESDTKVSKASCLLSPPLLVSLPSLPPLPLPVTCVLHTPLLGAQGPGP